MVYVVKNGENCEIFIFPRNEHESTTPIDINMKNFSLRNLTFDSKCNFVDLEEVRDKAWKIQILQEAFEKNLVIFGSFSQIYLMDAGCTFMKLLTSITSTNVLSTLDGILARCNTRYCIDTALVLSMQELTGIENQLKLEAIIDLVINCKLATFFNSEQNIFKEFGKKIKATAITITETATESSATLGIESAAQALGQAAAGVVVTVAIDVALTSHSLYRAKKEKDKGLITGKQFHTKVKKKVCESGFQFIGGTTGSVVGQLLIPVPGLGAFVGGLCGSLIGTGIGKGISYGLFDRNINSNHTGENESDSFKMIINTLEDIKLRNPQNISVYNEKSKSIIEVKVSEIASRNTKLLAERSKRSPSPIMGFATRNSKSSAESSRRSPSPIMSLFNRAVDTRNARNEKETRIEWIEAQDDRTVETENTRTRTGFETQNVTTETQNDTKQSQKTAGKAREHFKQTRQVFSTVIEEDGLSQTTSINDICEDSSKTGKSHIDGKSNTKPKQIRSVLAFWKKFNRTKTKTKDSDSEEQNNNAGKENSELTSNIQDYSQQDCLEDLLHTREDMAEAKFLQNTYSDIAQENQDGAATRVAPKQGDGDPSSSNVAGEARSSSNKGRESPGDGFASSVTQKIAASWRQLSLNELGNRPKETVTARATSEQEESGLFKRFISMLDTIGTGDQKEEDGVDIGSVIETQDSDEDSKETFTNVSYREISTPRDGDEAIKQRQEATAHAASSDDAEETGKSNINDSAKRFVQFWREKTIDKLDKRAQPEPKSDKNVQVEADRQESDKESDTNIFKKFQDLFKEKPEETGDEGAQQSAADVMEGDETREKNDETGDKEDISAFINDKLKGMVALFRTSAANARKEDGGEGDPKTEGKGREERHDTSMHRDESRSTEDQSGDRHHQERANSSDIRETASGTTWRHPTDQYAASEFHAATQNDESDDIDETKPTFEQHISKLLQKLVAISEEAGKSAEASANEMQESEVMSDARETSARQSYTYAKSVATSNADGYSSAYSGSRNANEVNANNSIAGGFPADQTQCDNDWGGDSARYMGRCAGRYEAYPQTSLGLDASTNIDKSPDATWIDVGNQSEVGCRDEEYEQNKASYEPWSDDPEPDKENMFEALVKKLERVKETLQK